MKKCPFCAEEIQGEDIECKHCSSRLSGSNKQTDFKSSSRNLKFTLSTWFEAILIMIGLYEISKGSFSGNNDYIIIGIMLIFAGITIFGVKKHFH